MSDIKWIKITTNMFEDEKIRLMDALPERDTIQYIWVRLLVQAGKTNSNGLIFLSENISYTDEMLSTIFCRPLASVRFALKTLKDFGLIEIDEDNIIKITNWDKHQNVEGMERVREQNKTRAKKYREKKKLLKEAHEKKDLEETEEDNISNSVMQDNSNVTENENNVIVTQQNKRESKKENKNKIKKESKSKSTFCEISTDLEDGEIKDLKSTHSQNKINSIDFEDTCVKAAELLKEYEEITGIANGLNIGAVKLAISMHGVKYVKMAINRALEVNKPDMNYINGILKNWRREGYPKDMEVNKNGINSFGKNGEEDKEQFTGFKLKRSRSLTEDERKRAEKQLI